MTTTRTRVTRLSLRKLYLETTPWVEISDEERRDLLAWLQARRSRSARRNQFDDGYENFLTFPVPCRGAWLVPLGHLTAFDRHRDSAGVLARMAMPSVITSRDFRQATYGDVVMRMRIQQTMRGAE